ncbi:hypothetical protein F5B22DRAFT_660021 [Xylaria bambusicola]|uniref:uncharacterized protein n=1 Tax=Xylaria bambusicola TaxID=326684 RepID=UPI0020079BB2|nr:uncharacterized protein F5B22DRAFT_660021 [Xylaria bambusicola]KAI0506638.1 hypothetical protein F5B22DRAFT_660021 [Xylaria bambusicola]
METGVSYNGFAPHTFDVDDGVIDEDSLSRCTVCDSDATLKCSLCGTVYCNPHCFRKDWPHHKALCKTAKDEQSVDKTGTVRAILFPVDSKKPVWAHISLDSLNVSIARALGITGKKPLKKAANQLVTNDINKSLTHRKVGHGIQQFTLPKTRTVEGVNLNESIFSLADPGSLRAYFGSAVFLAFGTVKFEGEGDHKASWWEDATPRDLRMIIEWYYTRPDNPCISHTHRLPIKSYSAPWKEAPLWPAVQILCDGDFFRFGVLCPKGLDNVQNVQVLSKDVFGIRTPSEIARMAGLPWLVQPCRSAVDPLLDKDKYDFLHNWTGRIYAQNKATTFRHWNIDHADGWTLPEHLDSTHCGSLVVLHARGCEIDKLHILGFNEYINQAFKQVVPLLTYEREGDQARVLSSRDELERVITREGFEAFWEEYISAAAGKLAPLYPSPYNETYAGERDPEPATEEEMEKQRKYVERMLLEGA